MAQPQSCQILGRGADSSRERPGHPQWCPECPRRLSSGTTTTWPSHGGASGASVPTPRGDGMTGKPNPCRYCGEPTWLADEHGPAHPCCRWWFEDEGRRHCPACRTSSALRSHDRRRQGSGDGSAPRRRARSVPESARNDARGGRRVVRACSPLTRDDYHALTDPPTRMSRPGPWQATDAVEASAVAGGRS